MNRARRTGFEIPDSKQQAQIRIKNRDALAGMVKRVLQQITIMLHCCRCIIKQTQRFGSAYIAPA